MCFDGGAGDVDGSGGISGCLVIASTLFAVNSFEIKNNTQTHTLSREMHAHEQSFVSKRTNNRTDEAVKGIEGARSKHFFLSL